MLYDQRDKVGGEHVAAVEVEVGEDGSELDTELGEGGLCDLGAVIWAKGRISKMKFIKVYFVLT